MRHCVKFIPSPSHSSSVAVALQARRQGLCPTEKNFSSQTWGHENEGLLTRTNHCRENKEQESLVSDSQ